jgi:hypothetical protein
MFGSSLPPFVSRVNVREYQRGKKWTIQRNWQHRVHTKMKGFTSIKSDDFEGKAVDIVDGDEVGWGHHQPLPTDENPITTQY